MGQNPERDKRILDLWDEGLTQGEVVKALAKEGVSVSRSVVAGVVHRAGKDLCKTGRSRPKVEKPAPKPPGRPRNRIIEVGKPKPPQRPDKQERANEPEPIGPIGEFPENGCQYSKGEITSQFQMCGHERRAGSPYCDWHLDNIPGLSIKKKRANG